MQIGLATTVGLRSFDRPSTVYIQAKGSMFSEMQLSNIILLLQRSLKKVTEAILNAPTYPVALVGYIYVPLHI